MIIAESAFTKEGSFEKERTLFFLIDMVKLLENEAIDELFINDLKIIQKRDNFRYGTDSVLLSRFANFRDNSKILDIGTGTGILPILLSAKNGNTCFEAIDVQGSMVEMAKRSVTLNALDERINVRELNVKDALKVFPKRCFDAIVTNPPYKKMGSGIPNDKKELYIARNEVCCNLEDIISISSRLLKIGGDFFMVQRPDRLCDSIYLMRQYKIEPRILTMVQSKKDNPPAMFLIKGTMGAGEELKITAPIYLDN